jgi:hypothetical protein
VAGPELAHEAAVDQGREADRRTADAITARSAAADGLERREERGLAREAGAELPLGSAHGAHATPARAEARAYLLLPHTNHHC